MSNASDDTERPEYENYDAVIDADSVVDQLVQLKESGDSKFENLVIKGDKKSVELVGMFYVPIDGVDRQHNAETEQ